MSDETTDELKPWQKGIPLERLKAMTQPFKDHIKPLCNGAFGCPNEQAVANAAVEGSFIQIADTVAIRKVVTSGASRATFSGEKYKIRSGDRAITCMAGDPAVMANIISKEMSQLPVKEGLLSKEGSCLWVITHQDYKPLVELLPKLGFSLVAVQISAGSDVKGAYVWGDVARAVGDSPKLTPVEVAGLVDMGRYVNKESRLAVLEEYEEVCATLMADHYSTYNKGSTWGAVALKGFDKDDPGFIIKPAEMSKKWKRENANRMDAKSQWTGLLEDMPITSKVIAGLPGDLDTIDRCRFMRLDPTGGALNRHADITDRDAGVADGKLVRLHIPIKTNRKVVYTGWDIYSEPHQFQMPPGHICYLDQRKPHACVNQGSTERIHLVIDMQSCPEVRDMIESNL